MIHLSQTNTNSFDELVFDHRNQAYGAYVLRREYPRYVLKSLLIGVAIIASILAIPYLANLFRHEVNYKTTTVDLTPTDLLKPDTKDPIPDPPKHKSNPPTGNTHIFVTPTIVTFEVDDTLPTKDDFDNKDPGLTNNIGEPGTWGIPGGGDGKEVWIDEEIPEYDIVNIEQKPEYPGGEEAMYLFLNENLQYPQHARDIGLEGKVYVTFIVDQFGNLVNIETPRPIGGGLDEEAIRVMKKMPRWKPGRQGGYPVKVRYNFPIVFKLN